MKVACQAMLISQCNYKDNEIFKVNITSAPADVNAVKIVLDRSDMNFVQGRTIDVLNDQSYEELEAKFEQLHAHALIKSRGEQQPLVIFVYVSGHGVLINKETHLVCPVSKIKVRFLNVEKEVQNLIHDTWGNVHVVAVFDCCRDPVSYDKYIKA